MLKKIFIIIFIILLIIVLFFLLYFLSQRTQLTGRASIAGEPSIENSYSFASPLIASAGENEKIRITVFVLDSQGRGVAGQPVFLGQNQNLTVFPVQSTTDAYGKAVFDVSSSLPLEYLVEVSVNGKSLPQKLRITFR
jgi:hypothetical protein